MIPTKIRLICPSGFREEHFLDINLSEAGIACGGHVCNQMETK
jgi:hypothetical protein